MKLINWGLNQPRILNRLEAMGYKIFTQKEFDLNIIGLRSPIRRPGLFDDEIRVCYKDGFDWIEENGYSNTIIVTSRGVLEYFTQDRLTHFFDKLNNIGQINNENAFNLILKIEKK